ncbi:uncharacterized protein [Procambarus clarkii]|uniref:uncharacterized protein n=1 Tax=Procambarus clarkii TaxID=6728 RepID=UPI003742D9A5
MAQGPTLQGLSNTGRLSRGQPHSGRHHRGQTHVGHRHGIQRYGGRRNRIFLKNNHQVPSPAIAAGATTIQPRKTVTGDAEAAGEDTGPSDNPTTGPIIATIRPTGAAGTPTSSPTSSSPEHELPESSKSLALAQASPLGRDRLEARLDRLDTGRRLSELSPPLRGTASEPPVGRTTPRFALSFNITASATRGTGPHTAGDNTSCTSTRTEDTSSGDSAGRGTASMTGGTTPHTTRNTAGDLTGDGAGRCG